MARYMARMRINVPLLILFSCLHAVLALATSLYTMGAGFARFDNPELPRTYGHRTVEVAANVLMFPGFLVWTPWASKNLPNAVEWLVFIVNSSLWGAFGAIIAGWVSRRRDRTRAREGHKNGNGG